MRIEMIKVLVLQDTLKTGIKEKIASKLFDYRTINFFGGKPAIEILEREKPDLVFCNFFKPVNGIDLMNMLRQIDEDVRLRAAIYSKVSFNNFFDKIFFIKPLGNFINFTLQNKKRQRARLNKA